MKSNSKERTPENRWFCARQEHYWDKLHQWKKVKPKRHNKLKLLIKRSKVWPIFRPLNHLPF